MWLNDWSELSEMCKLNSVDVWWRRSVPVVSCMGSSEHSSWSTAPGVWRTPVETGRGSHSPHRRGWWSPPADWWEEIRKWRVNVGHSLHALALYQRGESVTCWRRTTGTPSWTEPPTMRTEDEFNLTRVSNKKNKWLFVNRRTKWTYLGCPFLFAVTQECTKQAAVEVVQDRDQEQLVELEGRWKLQSGGQSMRGSF